MDRKVTTALTNLQTFIGLTGKLAVGAVKEPPHEHYHGLLSFVAWQSADGEQFDSRLHAFKELEDGEYEQMLEQISDFQVVKFSGRWDVFWGTERVRFQEILETNVENAWLESKRDELLKPEPDYQSQYFGPLAFDKHHVTYSGKTEWLGSQIDISFDVSPAEIGDVEKKVHVIWREAKPWKKRLQDALIKDFLSLKNEDWTDEAADGSGPITYTKDEFLRKVNLVSVSFDSSGNFTFAFDDGFMSGLHPEGLFGSHQIILQGSIENGVEYSDLFG